MLTVKQYVDEIKLRLRRFDVVLSLDDATIQTLLNRARREVQATTLGLMEYRYGRILVMPITIVAAGTNPPGYNLNPNINASGVSEQITTITALNRASFNPVTIWQTYLPADFIDATGVIMHYLLPNSTSPTVTWNFAMRRVDKRELFTVQSHSWNPPTIVSPTYAIEKNSTDSTVRMYFAGVDATGLGLTNNSL